MVKKTARTSAKLKGDSKLFAFLATFLSIIGFVIALLTKKNDKYVMHYAKQSLVIFIVYIGAVVITIVPIIGWLIGFILYIAATILWIISWIYALTGKVKEVPIVGKYGRKINL